MAQILVVGSLNMDLVALAPRLAGPGETLIGDSYFTAGGGKGANQAFAAARLGGDVAMFGRVGDDHYGTLLRADLAGAGCDVGAVASVAGPSGVALILVSREGQNAIVVVPGANAALSPGDIAAEAARFAGARYVLLQLESPLETVVAAACAARTAGGAVILDPAPAVPDLPAALFGAVDYLTPNESEAQQLCGRAPGPLSLQDAAGLAMQLRDRGPRHVILKLGARGCLIADARGATLVAAPAVEVRDTTAAGDVFNGALAVALSEGAALEKACAIACQAAALSVQHLGAQPSMPSRADLDAALAAQGQAALPINLAIADDGFCHRI